MTPKEKAMQIFNRMCNSVDELLPFDVKQCALITVDEISQHCYQVMKPFWEEVKQEIENL